MLYVKANVRAIHPLIHVLGTFSVSRNVWTGQSGFCTEQGFDGYIFKAESFSQEFLFFPYKSKTPPETLCETLSHRDLPALHFKNKMNASFT